MNTYITFTKKRIIATLAIFICVGLVCCELYAAANKTPNAKTNADRLIFIKRLGYTITQESLTAKTVTIPEVFYDVYKNYNTLQQKGGYDLSDYKGCTVTLYTYKINTPKGYKGECAINIIVYNDRIIGGDISSAALDGFMLPLKAENEKTKN
ncbi:MAG: DUF4830 domain-containing protein [Clostridia bacterium]|nr:DUF4830 domain-containing protein [Clostridia bacterium]